jgi:hypothetical protein
VLMVRPWQLLPVLAVLALFPLLHNPTALAASDLTVQLAVNPPTATTGQTITVMESVTNSSANRQSVTLTNTLQGPLSGSDTQHIHLAPGQTYTQTRGYTVDATTPRGTYTLTVSATDKSGTTISSASYTIY